MVDTGTFQATVPKSGQWGPIRAHSAYTAQETLSSWPQFFVPNPEIQDVDNTAPFPGDIINVSGLALSGVTGAFFGGTDLVESARLELTGLVLSGSVTDVRSLPIQVPTGDIHPYLTLVGQSGLSDVF